MGLDTSHNCWHGAYGSFSRWRDELARVAGYEFRQLESEFKPFPDVDWDKYHADLINGPLMGRWDETPEDPLLVLIVHSDCDGWIYHAQTKALADRLTELLPLLSDANAGGHIGHWHEKTQQFIDGLLLAHELGEDVEFR
jgi:hypothetical protein